MALGLDFWQAGKPDRWRAGRQPLELPEYHMVAPLPLHRADMQLAVVNQLRWYPRSISIDAHHITMEGWALALWDPQDQLRFLVNGVDFEDLEWPLPSLIFSRYLRVFPMPKCRAFGVTTVAPKYCGLAKKNLCASM